LTSTATRTQTQTETRTVTQSMSLTSYLEASVFLLATGLIITVIMVVRHARVSSWNKSR
jgi:hypothetical protein